MSSFSKFSELKPKLYPLEEQRKLLIDKLRQQIILAVGLMVAGSAANYYYFQAPALIMDPGQHAIWPYIVLLVTLLILFGWLRHKHISAYQNTVKSKVVSELVKSADPNLAYSPDDFVDKQAFTNSGLFDQSVARYKGEDLISGHRNDTKFRLSEIDAEEKRGKNTATFFKGVFLVIDLNQNISGQTFILPAHYRESLGSKISKKLWSGGRPGDLVDLADEDFSEVFQVISDDAMRARNLMQENFKSTLLHLEEQFMCDLRLAFKDRHCYVALETDDDLFAISPYNSLLQPELIKDFEEDLDALLQLVDALSTKKREEEV